MSKVLCIVLCFILCVWSCSNNEPVIKDFDPVKVEGEVKKMFENYHAAIKEGGLKAEFDYLDQSPDFFWVPPGYSSALDIDSVQAILTKNAPLYSAIDFHWTHLVVHPLSDRIATFTGQVGGVMADTNGMQQIISILESGTVIKRDSGWKLLSGQSRTLDK